MAILLGTILSLVTYLYRTSKPSMRVMGYDVPAALPECAAEMWRAERVTLRQAVGDLYSHRLRAPVLELWQRVGLIKERAPTISFRPNGSLHGAAVRGVPGTAGARRAHFAASPRRVIFTSIRVVSLRKSPALPTPKPSEAPAGTSSSSS